MVLGHRSGDHGHMETRDHAFTTTDSQRPAEPRRIKRSRSDRMLGGVCGGIAKHFDLDPVLVRIATIALVCAVGAGAVAYIAAWALMPLEDEPAAAMPSAPQPVHA
jgi:phage shock protein PspC (stress-responsive transcriptional regulator)